MNYAELLKRMPVELRRRLETEVYASWLQRGGSLADVCTDPVVMETFYNRMSYAERAVLRCLVMRIGGEAFDYARIERSAAAALSGAETKLGFTGLLRKGIVFAFRKTWGEYVYLMPGDGFGRWRRLLFSEEPAGSVNFHSLTPEVTRSAVSELRDELFHVLVHAAQLGLKLTKTGTLPKKQLQKLAEQIRLDEPLFAGAALKYAYADTYPLKVALVLDFLLRLQLVMPGEEELVLNTETLQDWLLLPSAEQTGRLYEIWKQFTLPADAWMQHAVCLLERMGSDGEWFSGGAVISRLLVQGIVEEPSLAAQHTKELQERWLMPLVAFGWMEEGIIAEEGTQALYRWRSHPLSAEEAMAAEPTEDEGGFMVQPDFDILVPPDLSGAALWELCCLADAVQLDQVSVYKLTKNSVRRALENGRTAQDMLDFLQRHAMYGVPEHVRLTVEQWSKPYGKTGFVQALLLRCADHGTAQAIEKLPGTKEYILDKLGERDYLVKPEAIKPLTAALEKAGYMPGVPLSLNGNNTQAPLGAYPRLDGVRHKRKPEQLLQAAEQGLIYSRTSVHYLDMEARIPTTAELYPELQEIPAVWLKDYRSYHASTRKEIVEKAIRLKTVLQIRKDGNDYRIAPQKVQETRGTWCMTGVGRADDQAGTGDEIHLMADEWQEMKLILPGINDKY